MCVLMENLVVVSYPRFCLDHVDIDGVHLHPCCLLVVTVVLHPGLAGCLGWGLLLHIQQLVAEERCGSHLCIITSVTYRKRKKMV